MAKGRLMLQGRFPSVRHCDRQLHNRRLADGVTRGRFGAVRCGAVRWCCEGDDVVR